MKRYLHCYFPVSLPLARRTEFRITLLIMLDSWLFYVLLGLHCHISFGITNSRLLKAPELSLSSGSRLREKMASLASFGRHGRFLEAIQSVLASTAYVRRTVAVGPKARRAAVLAPLIVRQDDLHVLFTLRTSHLTTHAGQVSFPGGHVEPGETPEIAALRECEEELGATLPLQVLGQLHEVIAVTGTHVTPVLATCSSPLEDLDASLRPNANEVELAFSLPLRHLADPANHSFELLPPKIPREGGGSSRHPRAGLWVPVFHGGPARIWGLTAYMLHSFLLEVAAPAAAHAGYALPAPKLPPPPPTGDDYVPMSEEEARQQILHSATSGASGRGSSRTRAGVSASGHTSSSAAASSSSSHAVAKSSSVTASSSPTTDAAADSASKPSKMRASVRAVVSPVAGSAEAAPFPA